jgi:hypothetical protein
MTETAAEPPVLKLPDEMMRVAPQLLIQMAQVLRERRLKESRLAWDEPEHAARVHDEFERVAAQEPPVRTMSPTEMELVDQPRETRESSTAHTATDVLTVEVQPMPGTGRAALIVEIRERDGSRDTGEGQRVDRETLSCEDLDTARRLADEMLAAGPDRRVLGELRRRAVEAGARWSIASNAVEESGQARTARAATALQALWGEQHPELVQRMMHGDRGWPRLVEQLHLGELRGQGMSEVLGRVDPRRLGGRDVHSPAGLASHLITASLDEAMIIDGDAVAEPAARARTPRAKASAEPPKPGKLWMLHTLEETVAPYLANAVRPQLMSRVRESPMYHKLLAELMERFQDGVDIAAVVRQLPVSAIEQANEPGAYLRRVVLNRLGDGRSPYAAATSTEGRMPIDMQTRANLRAVLGSEAPVVERCAAWPMLARTMHTAQKRDGLDVREVLRAVTDGETGRSFLSDRKPAASLNERMLTAMHVARKQRGGPTAGAEAVTDTEALGQQLAAERLRAERAETGRGTERGGVVSSNERDEFPERRHAAQTQWGLAAEYEAEAAHGRAENEAAEADPGEAPDHRHDPAAEREGLAEQAQAAANQQDGLANAAAPRPQRPVPGPKPGPRPARGAIQPVVSRGRRLGQHGETRGSQNR